VIDLNPHCVECRVCGEAVYLGEGFGIPMYEDDVLPNDWPGEWGGFPACQRCFLAQQGITKPTPVSELLAPVTS